MIRKKIILGLAILIGYAIIICLLLFVEEDNWYLTLLEKGIVGGIGLSLLTYAAAENFTKENSIAENILCILSFVFLILALATVLLFLFEFFVVPLIIGYITLFYLEPSIVILAIGFAIAPLITSLSFIVSTRFSNSFWLFPFLRLLTRITFYAFPFVSFLLPCIAIIISGKENMEFVIILYAIFFLLSLSIIVICNRHTIDIYGKHFVLYLRSFSDDDAKLYESIKNINPEKGILKIGNPRHFNDSESFFLPNSHWKKYLDYYINRASLIYADISATEGVVWEVFEHIQDSTKFIYIVKSKSSLLKTIESNNIIQYKDSSIYNLFVSVLSDTNIPDQFSFTSNGSVFFELIPTKKISDYEITAPILMDKDVKQNTYFNYLDLKRTFKKFFVEGIGTSISSFIKAISSFIKAIAIIMPIIIAILKIIAFLLALALILGSIYLFLIAPADITLEDSLMQRLLYCWISIGIGVSIISKLIE